MVRITKLRLLALRLLAAATLLVSSLGMVASASAAADIKAVPQAPFQNTITAPVASKTALKPDAVHPDVAWTASLTPPSQSLWPTQYATITATTNQNVGPTPYYLSIYDQTSASFVAICGTGTTCAASVTQATATTHYYVAYVSGYPTVGSPPNIQVMSATAYIQWRSNSVTLQASTPTVGVGTNATLTATTSVDIGPTPFYTEIYDTTTGVRVGVCGVGTTCTATTSQATATTHRFIAYISQYSTANPPTGIQATSNPVFSTWNTNGYRVSLSTVRSSVGHDTLTANTNVNVGPTPYYIEIYNLNTGARLTYCGTGTTCSVTTGLGIGRNNFVAFISTYSTTLPPTSVQANSSIVSDFYLPIIIHP